MTKPTNTQAAVEMMRAATYREYGAPEVVAIEEVAKPTPAAGEVRIAIRATTVSAGDWRMRSAIVPRSFRFIAPLVFGKRPKQQVLGTELSGVIDAVGEGVTRWKVGDEVFAFPGAKLGAHAEYICLDAEGPVAAKPANLSFEEAASLSFGGATAMSFIEKSGGIEPGEKVLVVGASGAVGSAMVQIAKYYGAEVTGVCSGKNAELVRSLGADHIIDYTREDFSEGERLYDVIMETTLSAPIARSKKVLKKGGRFLAVNAELCDMIFGPMTWGAKVVAGPAKEDPAYLPVLAEMAKVGAYRPHVDRSFTLQDIVEAHRYVDTGRKRGNVVVLVGANA